jgi:hypothetical protein
VEATSAIREQPVGHVGDLGFHADRCPVARTIGGCVDITTSLELTT